MSDASAVELVWEEPPAPPERAHGGGKPVSEKWLAVAELLKSAPGNPARIDVFENRNSAVGLAGRIRKGESAAFTPAGHFDAVWRPLSPDAPDGPFGVWAKYIGEQTDPVAELAKEKTATLKDMAKARGLKVSGNRLELAERIVKHDQENPDPNYEE